MRNSTAYMLALAILYSIASTSFAQELFSEDWDDGSGSTRWSAPIVALENPGISFDGTVDYSFDYSSIGAGSAPNSSGGTTIGVSMQTNLTDQCPDDLSCGGSSNEGEGVGIVPLSALADTPTGDFIMTADMYHYVVGTDGTTEYATLGVFSQGTAVPARFNIDPGDGLAWSIDGEGGSTNDIYRFEAPPGNEVPLGRIQDIPDGSIPGVPTGEENEAVGPQNQWVEIAISSTEGIISYSMNGFVIDTYDNSNEDFFSGKLLISQHDPFNSVNPGGVGNSNMVVFDNISLRLPSDNNGDYDGDNDVDGQDFLDWQRTDGTSDGLTAWQDGYPAPLLAITAVPEPTSLALLSLAGLGMLGLRLR